MTKQNDWEEEFSLNRHWWIARAVNAYGVTKEVAELIYEDMQAVLGDKQEDVCLALKQERLRVLDEVKLEKKVLHMDERCMYCGRPEWECDCGNRETYNEAVDDLEALISKLKEEE
jgi:hypothetical protein